VRQRYIWYWKFSVKESPPDESRRTKEPRSLFISHEDMKNEKIQPRTYFIVSLLELKDSLFLLPHTGMY
jgi:hypothetical protein